MTAAITPAVPEPDENDLIIWDCRRIAAIITRRARTGRAAKLLASRRAAQKWGQRDDR